MRQRASDGEKRAQCVLAGCLYGGTVVRRPAALMVHKSVWTGWSDAAPVRPSHVENESDHFYGVRVSKLSPTLCWQWADKRCCTRTRHSISAGLELIKLSFSDSPCLYGAPHSIATPLWHTLFLALHIASVSGTGTQMLTQMLTLCCLVCVLKSENR